MCFNLNSTLVYSQISRELAKEFNFKEINNLLKCIDESGYKEDINVSHDECISTCIRVFAATNSSESSQSCPNGPSNSLCCNRSNPASEGFPQYDSRL